MKTKHRWLLLSIIVTLVLVTLACGGSTTPTATTSPPTDKDPSTAASEATATTGAQDTPTNTPTATPEPPTPTPRPIGLTRQNPYTPTAVVQAPNWEIQVLEMLRGADAWSQIEAANMFNEPAPEGQEYLLLKLHVRSLHDDDETHWISESDFGVTGERLIQYRPTEAVPPEPVLDAELYGGGKTEGWAVYLVGAKEENLMVVIDEVFNFDADRRRYVALQPGTSVGISEALYDLEANDRGTARDTPAPLGETMRTPNWEVAVQETVAGDAAWRQVQAANQFNDPPEEGRQYVLVKVHARYIGIAERPMNIDEYAFQSTGSAGTLYDLPSVVTPRPVLDQWLYPGGETTGWVTLQSAIDETDLKAVFEPAWGLTGETRFLALEP